MIKRLKNKDIPTDTLRLQASERNENWPKKLFKKFKKSIRQADIKFYPNLEVLYKRLRGHYNVETLLIGTGSDKCIETFLQAHMETYKKLVVFTPSFPMYAIYGKLYGYEVIEVPHKSLEIPYEQFLSKLDKDSIAIISNPSSPLGQKVDSEFIHKLLYQNIPTLIDEAYIEFSDCSSMLSYTSGYKNLFVTRTFSKALGSAGVRLGIIAYHPSKEDIIEQFRPMYEINGLTIRWALTVLDNYKHVQKYYKKVKNVRSEIVDRCNISTINVIPGECNWVHIRYSELPKGIIFKDNCSIPGSKDSWVRLQITSKLKDYIWLK
jgi:histidinol-phosphate aminotransferase